MTLPFVETMKYVSLFLSVSLVKFYWLYSLAWWQERSQYASLPYRGQIVHQGFSQGSEFHLSSYLSLFDYFSMNPMENNSSTNATSKLPRRAKRKKKGLGVNVAQVADNTSEFSFAIAKTAVAQICQSVGYKMDDLTRITFQ